MTTRISSHPLATARSSGVDRVLNSYRTAVKFSSPRSSGAASPEPHTPPESQVRRGGTTTTSAPPTHRSNASETTDSTADNGERATRVRAAPPFPPFTQACAGPASVN